MIKVALITGASGGIGSVVGEELRSRGYNLGLLDIDIEAGDSQTELLQNCDVTKVGAVEEAVSNALNRFGRVDVLVNCAGRSHLGMIDELTLEDLDNVYDVNVKGAFNVTKAVLPYMKNQGSGYIVNIGSLRGIECAEAKGAYCMSKFALRAFSKTLRKEVERFGIKVTVINPGFVDTNVYGDIQLRPHVQTIPGASLKEAPLTRPVDIAKTVLYLLDLSPGACIEELNIGRLWGF
jgi:NADP-dependent 3-hydroxy acid dehydrogenase YdfG